MLCCAARSSDAALCRWLAKTRNPAPLSRLRGAGLLQDLLMAVLCRWLCCADGCAVPMAVLCRWLCCADAVLCCVVNQHQIAGRFCEILQRWRHRVLGMTSTREFSRQELESFNVRNDNTESIGRSADRRAAMAGRQAPILPLWGRFSHYRPIKVRIPAPGAFCEKSARRRPCVLVHGFSAILRTGFWAAKIAGSITQERGQNASASVPFVLAVSLFSTVLSRLFRLIDC